MQLWKVFGEPGDSYFLSFSEFYLCITFLLYLDTKSLGSRTLMCPPPLFPMTIEIEQKQIAPPSSLLLKHSGWSQGLWALLNSQLCFSSRTFSAIFWIVSDFGREIQTVLVFFLPQEGTAGRHFCLKKGFFFIFLVEELWHSLKC